MARIYENPAAEAAPDVEGAKLKQFDPATRRALIKFWISAPAIILASVLLYLLSRSKVEPTLAITAALLVAIAALILLVIMNRSLLSMHVLTRKEAGMDKKIDKFLAQMDDRFAVFNQVQLDDFLIDHIIVGPTGCYIVKISGTDAGESWARSGDIEQLLAEKAIVLPLLSDLLNGAAVTLEPVLCVPHGVTERVNAENTGVWVVPADKIAVSLIKRSSQDGAIGKNVNETGAFSNDMLLSVAVERALSNHFNMPTRKTRVDFAPPKRLTGENSIG